MIKQPSDSLSAEAGGGADQRDRDADERERALDGREDLIEAREAVYADRLHDAQGILADAEVRDHEADARDWAADKRDMAANLRAFTSGEDNATHDARRLATRNRSDSKTDRASSAVDRFKLTEDDDPRHSSLDAGTEPSMP